MAGIAAKQEHSPPALWRTLGECAVLVVPGFGTNDAATALLRQHLRDAGFRVYAWKQGVNRGPGGMVMRRLANRVRSIAKRSRRPVHIVGWSLGGLMGRVVAGRLPSFVDRVIALGSPLTADPGASRLSAIYGWIAHRPLSERTLQRMLRESATAPVVSIYTRNDGVVDWKASAEAPGECRVREVDSTHLGMMVDPVVHNLVVSELKRAA